MNQYVANIQNQLNSQGAGLKVDGIWGPKTQAAYEQYNAAAGAKPAQTQTYADPTFNSYYNTILSGLPSYEISYEMPTMDSLAGQISAYLRPSYDQAIANRKTQTQQYRADTDVDAASRGMGRSTWIDDVKSKAANAESTDIANLESNYGAALAEALLNQYNQHLANKLNVDMQNAQMRAQNEQLAYNRAGDMYGLTQSAKSSGGGGRSGNNSTGTAYDTEIETIANRYKNYLLAPSSISSNSSFDDRRNDIRKVIADGKLEKQYPGINAALKVVLDSHTVE